MCYYPVMVCVWNASPWTPVLRLGCQLVGLLGEDITTLGGILQNKCVTGDGLHTRPASPVYASCSARCEWPTSLSARFYNSLVSQTDPKSQSKPIKHWNPGDHELWWTFPLLFLFRVCHKKQTCIQPVFIEVYHPPALLLESAVWLISQEIRRTSHPRVVRVTEEGSLHPFLSPQGDLSPENSCSFRLD